MSYATYAVELKPVSSCITLLQSDTIFGSLMWTLKYVHGEKILLEYLSQFDQHPPILLSNGMPKGFMVKPKLTLDENVLKTACKNPFESASIYKKIKKIYYIPEEVFAQLCRSLNPESITKELIKIADTDKDSDITFLKKERIYKNMINRKTFQTHKDSGLFIQKETRLNPKFNWVIYIKFDTEGSLISFDELAKLLKITFESGYGKKKSTGKGYFKIENIEEAYLPSIDSPNGFISLSNFIPAAGDPTIGFYEIINKYGKLGGDFAYSVRGPWKKPLRMISEGATFSIKSKLKEYYGCMISGVHPKKSEVKQFAYAFPVGVNLNGNIQT